MFGFGKKQKSGEIAKNRLQLVIYQDRMKTNPETVDQLKHELLAVIMRFIDIDKSEPDIIKISQPTSNDMNEPLALEVNIPIKGWKVR